MTRSPLPRHARIKGVSRTFKGRAIWGLGSRSSTIIQEWPARFAEEKAAILEAIGHWVVVIEYIGSTAVPGLGAKPIIDIMVGVRQLADARCCIVPLAAIGYEYVPQFEDEMPERRYFRKGPQTRHFHLHMVELGS